jgi:hypothetical protein
MELLFELPAAYRQGTLVLADVGSEGLDAGDTFVPADPLKLIGTFKEALPRNLEPLLEHPVMAALQSGGPGEMTVRAVRGGYGLAFHASGVRGLATYSRSGIYDVTLRHEGERLACKLQLIDSGKRAMLHLANKPWRTMTFVRDGASLDETPQPQTQPRTRPIPPAKTPRREDDDEQDDRRPPNNGEVNEPRFFDD